jgi:hypothetical protein
MPMNAASLEYPRQLSSASQRQDSQQERLPIGYDISSTANLSPTSSVMSTLSNLAGRRGFFVRPVRTSGLRKISQGCVYRAPEHDRLANGEAAPMVSTSRLDSFEGEPNSPFGQALQHRKSRASTAERRESSGSCSPPDERNGRRRLSNNSSMQAMLYSAPPRRSGIMFPAADEQEHAPGRPSKQTLRDYLLEANPESPGASIQRKAAQRRHGGAKEASRRVPVEEALGESADFPCSQPPPVEEPIGRWAIEPSSPSKKHRR